VVQNGSTGPVEASAYHVNHGATNAEEYGHSLRGLPTSAWASGLESPWGIESFDNFQNFQPDPILSSVGYHVPEQFNPSLSSGFEGDWNSMAAQTFFTGVVPNEQSGSGHGRVFSVEESIDNRLNPLPYGLQGYGSPGQQADNTTAFGAMVSGTPSEFSQVEMNNPSLLYPEYPRADYQNIYPDMLYGAGQTSPAQQSNTSAQVFSPATAPVSIGSRIACTQPNCPATFGRASDLNRHLSAVHRNNQGAHLCPVFGCPKSQGAGYSRADKVKEHLWKKHGNLGYTKAF
jgi:hypothetical protein